MAFSRPSIFIAGNYVADESLGPRLAVFPHWLHVEVIVEGRQLSLQAGRVLEHRRLLDLRQGVLFREWRQQDPSGRITRLNYLRLASLADRHVIVQSMPYERKTMQGTSRSRAVLVGGMAASAGCFDRQVLVDRPDRKGRLEILKVHVRKVQLERAIDLDTVAALTTGFTGADIANLVNEAAIVATRRNATAVSLKDFTEAIERIVA